MKNFKFISCTTLFLIFACNFLLAAPNFQLTVNEPILAGTDKGLYKIHNNKELIPLWIEGDVRKIVKSSSGWYFLTSEGILFSEKFETFEKRNEGLPVNKIKKIKDGQKSFEIKQKELKDLAIHPEKEQILVTATKDAVYLTKDGGFTWKNIGLNARTSGVKSLAVFDQPIINEEGIKTGSELVIYVSHSIYGFAYYRADVSNPKWTDMEKGFINLPNQKLTEEVASMLPVKNTENDSYDLYLGSTYIPRIYKLDWQNQKVDVLWNGGNKNATQDSLVKVGNKLIYLGLGGFKALDLSNNEETELPENVEIWQRFLSFDEKMNCLFIPEMRCSGRYYKAVNLSELWLLKNHSVGNKFYEKANDIRGIYVPANQICDERLEKHIATLKENNLNAIVVDMKDDAGLLRFDAKTPLVKELGTKSQYSVELDKFVERMKKEEIYLIARIVVFKDKNLYRYAKGKYSVWDKQTNSQWRGIRGKIDVKDEEGNVIKTEDDYYDEYWVDPYCDVVWEYNVAVAKELIERGFDEIQFDYIRFPTDGRNLHNAKYRYYENGMDRESALISFLSYARENIDAPIGIDIYGSNGWYRSGARTGQDVELMSHYVDVICPMFYPSHFEQNFLDYSPTEERPYRIYNFGSYRNTIIGRNKIIVRPWVQAFFLRVSYDVKYYNKDYVKREVKGIKDSVNDGYLYWNNIGRYEDISSDKEIDEFSAVSQ